MKSEEQKEILRHVRLYLVAKSSERRDIWLSHFKELTNIGKNENTRRSTVDYKIKSVDGPPEKEFLLRNRKTLKSPNNLKAPTSLEDADSTSCFRCMMC